MRLFLAINLPSELQSSIGLQLETLKKLYPQFSWIPSKNYHITLHFFGEASDQKTLVHRIEKITFDCPQFYLYAYEVDMFIHNRIIIHINFHREKKLDLLVSGIKNEFDSGNRLRYLPHLTVGRYKIPSKQQYLLLQKKLSQIPVEFEFKVEKIILFESIAGGTNPTYKSLHEFRLHQ